MKAYSVLRFGVQGSPKPYALNLNQGTLRLFLEAPKVLGNLNPQVSVEGSGFRLEGSGLKAEGLGLIFFGLGLRGQA